MSLLFANVIPALSIENLSTPAVENPITLALFLNIPVSVSVTKDKAGLVILLESSISN
jgi:hypothetical protein